MCHKCPVTSFLYVYLLSYIMQYLLVRFTFYHRIALFIINYYNVINITHNICIMSS